MKGGYPYPPGNLIVKLPVVADVDQSLGAYLQELAYPPIKLMALLHQTEVGGSRDDQIEISCQSSLPHLHLDELPGRVGEDDERIALPQPPQHRVDLRIDPHLRGVLLQEFLPSPGKVQVSEPVLDIIPFQGPIPDLAVLRKDHLPRLAQIHPCPPGEELGDTAMPALVGEGEIEEGTIKVK